MANLQKIKEIADEKNISLSALAGELGITPQALFKLMRNNSTKIETLEKIATILKVPIVSFFEEGDVTSVESGKSIQFSDSLSGIPYYSEMPVSAGSADLQLMDGDERAVGYIRIAGVSGKCAFPVVGCSMEPVIHAGDIVVVDVLDRYELIDPDKIYMIVTSDDRMIKHIETDESNPDILWCVSPNYRRFSILKTDIRQIFKVTFYGRFV
jgi:transcriptional regulator with XRE-family HTH domain